jgi:probable rRNA maturation factor
MRTTRQADAKRASTRPPARPERLAVDVSANRTRAGINASRLKRLARYVLRAERKRDAMLSIALVSSAQIAKLNEDYLGHAGPTDVIAFALSSPGKRATFALGDVYICPAVARASARAFRIPFGDELERLVVHGTLHVLGWDHPTGPRREQSRMWRRQEQLLERWRATGDRS